MHHYNVTCLAPAILQKRGTRDLGFIFCFDLTLPAANVGLRHPSCGMAVEPMSIVEAWCRCLQHWSGTDRSNRDNCNYKTTDFWTEFLDGFFWHGFIGRIFDGFLDGFCDDELDGFCDDELGAKLLWAFHSIFLLFCFPFPTSTPKLHLGMVADWQINESTLRAWSFP